MDNVLSKPNRASQFDVSGQLALRHESISLGLINAISTGYLS